VPETAPAELAARLNRLLPVVDATVVPPAEGPRDAAVVDTLLREEWDTLPETPASVAYDAGFAPTVVDSRAGHRRALFVSR